MSLTSLAQKEILRRERANLRKFQTHKLYNFAGKIQSEMFATESSTANDFAEKFIPYAVNTLSPEQPLQQNQATNVLDSLVKYIPTESITLYVAASSAMEALKSQFNFINEERTYWFFGLLTPILFLLIYIGKRRSANIRPLLPKDLKVLPWWKIVASTIAFLAWALAIPNAPYLHAANNVGGGAVAAFLAIFISTFLSILEPIFEPQNGEN